MDSMIKVEDVSMKFNLGIEKNFSLKLFFINMFKPKKKDEKKGNKDFWALKHVNFEGKSTLLKVVSGVMKPTEGKITVAGNICPMIELGAGFDMDLTARENIYLNGSILGYSREFIDQKFDEIVSFSELQDFLEVPVRNFSSGMVARLAFSIATQVDPEILIVDEILSVGDLNFQQKSEAKMRSMITGGTTVLYVSHSIDSIRSLCDKVVWLDHGKVVMSGNTEKVCQAYYDSQVSK